MKISHALKEFLNQEHIQEALDNKDWENIEPYLPDLEILDAYTFFLILKNINFDADVVAWATDYIKSAPYHLEVLLLHMLDTVRDWKLSSRVGEKTWWLENKISKDKIKIVETPMYFKVYTPNNEQYGFPWNQPLATINDIISLLQTEDIDLSDYMWGD